MGAPGLLLLLLCARLAAAQHYLSLRPSPSNKLPVHTLVEVPDPEYDPRETDLNEQTLRKKLGSHFDPGFMSVSAPPQLNATTHAPLPPPPGPLPLHFRRLDLSATPYGARLRTGKKARRKLVQLLWTYTHCPVLYRWKDLGVRFWPRYIKEGTCFSERSCSLPAGMTCQSDKAINKTFLRWHCQGFLRQKYCTWIPMQYPIISTCKCSC